MSPPTSESARDPHIDRVSPSNAGLFSHAPGAEVSEEHRDLADDGIDWRATPFSGRLGEPRRGSR